MIYWIMFLAGYGVGIVEYEKTMGMAAMSLAAILMVLDLYFQQRAIKLKYNETVRRIKNE